MSTVPVIDTQKLLQIHREVLAAGCTYGLGAKAKLSAAPGDFHAIDCSGYVRWLLFQATYGVFSLIDGSQNQRVWCEKQGLHKVANYSDIARYNSPGRLFIAFIQPYQHGAGSVGHVWLLMEIDGVTKTIESHGGKGPDSRAWDTGVLLREEAEAFELPAK